MKREEEDRGQESPLLPTTVLSFHSVSPSRQEGLCVARRSQLVPQGVAL